LIITGATRDQALARARRALAEFIIDGMPTALPFHRAIVSDPAFTDSPFRVHTRWIETEFENTIPAFDASAPLSVDAQRRAMVIEVDGQRFEVNLPDGIASNGHAGVKRSHARSSTAVGASGNSLTSPMQGTVVKVAVAEGDSVEAGALIVVLEAMKMEQPIIAHKAGTVNGLTASVGATLSTGAVICDIAD
jgi:acetyl-CoA/propionyl-CoA carboxylase biotin carboxyl carrier protein